MLMTGNGNSTIKMTSSKPYIIQALHEWIVDNNLTPYLLVNALHENVLVPLQYVDNGKIVLNITPIAVSFLVLERDHVSFEARFRGIIENIYVPMHAILAIYAKENGRGMAFDEEESPPPGDGGGSDGGGSRPTLVSTNKVVSFGKQSHLKIVK